MKLTIGQSWRFYGTLCDRCNSLICVMSEKLSTVCEKGRYICRIEFEKEMNSGKST